MKQGSNSKAPRFEAFKNKLWELMDKDMTQTEFAEKLGLTRQTLGFYLNGERIPDALGIVNICRKTGVSADWLLGLSEIKKADPSLSNACSYLGLGEEETECLSALAKSDDGTLQETIKMLFCDERFSEIIRDISHYKKCLQAQLEFDDNEMDENDIDTIHALQDKYHFQLTPPSGAAVLYRQKAVNNFEEHIKQIWRIYFFRPYIEKGGASDAQHQENDK